jgi:hypothetical protein
MDDRQVSRLRTSTLTAPRMTALAIVAVAASYAGAWATSRLMQWLADTRQLPESLMAAFDPSMPPSPAWHASVAAGGALLGLAAVALAALFPGRRAAGRVGARGAEGLAPAPRETALDPAESLAWLHVVSGPSARRAGHAAAELAASWIARGERVLLIDGGPRLRLHGPLLAEPALGLGECLDGRMPLLGVVQCVGVPGLYVLAHGAPIPMRAWAELGRLVDDARPHFDRVLLALDLGAPYDVGRALAGRYFEAWWSDPNPEQRAGAMALSERIGIRMRGMELGSESNPMLETLRRRIALLRPAGLEPPAPLVVGELRPAPEAPAAVRAEPLVLDSDLQVRERLRFLIWMRRLQREDPAGSAPARLSAIAAPQTVTGG